MSDDIKNNLKKQSTWMRGLYIILFVILLRLADIILIAVVFFQFIHKLITGDTNERLLKLGQHIATYIYQIAQFLSFNSDQHPYPFGAWPKGEPKTTAKKVIASETAKKTK